MDQREQASRRPDLVGRTFLRTFLLDRALLLVALASLCALLIADPGVSKAQAPPITASGLNTQVGPATTLPNGMINYDLTGGTRPGNGPNLFHSFGEFSVPVNNIANFLNETHLPTNNILSRVTSGNPSNIFGTIQTTDFGSAHLFLMNPSGILFGPNASLNVGGSVSFTTANYIRLFDGVNSSNFYANPASDSLANSVLSTAPLVNFGFLTPAAFGFLQSPDPIGTITVQGSALSVSPGQSISLVGGDITMSGGALSAPSGQINLVSVASAGEVLYPSLQLDPN